MDCRTYRLPNGTNIILAYATTFFTRFCGLMLRKKLPENCGLLLAPCSSIHMLFMRFAIDAIYIDEAFRVQKIARNLRPWLGFSACLGAWGVIEVPAGTAAAWGLAVGEQLRLGKNG